MIDKVHLPGVSVLVVDDDNVTRSLITKTLIAMGVEKVLEADDGADGLLLAVKEQPTLIVSDLYMRTVNAFSMIAGIRFNENEKIANIPIILFTGETAGKTLQKVRSLGVDILMVKPFIAESFSKAITRLLNIPQLGPISMPIDSQKFMSDLIAELQKKKIDKKPWHLS